MSLQIVPHIGMFVIKRTGTSGNIPEQCQGHFVSKHQAQTQIDLYEQGVTNRIEKQAAKPKKVQTRPRKKAD